MKNKIIFLMVMLSFLLISGTTQVYADIILDDYYPSDSFTNPDSFSPADPDAELAWLEGFLGYEVELQYLGKDEPYLEDGETENPLWDEWNGNWTEYAEGITGPVSWDYAVLKYGNTFLAIYDDDDNDTIDYLYYTGEYANLSHVTYFRVSTTNTYPVPEPANMLLLGSGLVGLAGFGRKKFKKD